MNILQVNKFYFEKGGAERYMFSLSRLLRNHGHTVLPFAVNYPQTVPTPYQKFFVSPIETERVSVGKEGIRTMMRFFWSLEAMRKLEALLDHHPIDIAHLHNIYHQISPSILNVFEKRRIPVVHTLHDYHLISPAYNLYAHGGVCRHTQKKSFFHALPHRCAKNSFLASALCATELTMHRKLKIYERKISRFIAPTQAILNIFSEWGYQLPNTTLLPNFIFTENFKTTAPPTGNVLFLGRLIPDKGTRTLAQLIEMLPAVHFTIAGDGPERSVFERLARMHPRVRYLGIVPPQQIPSLLQSCGLVVMPSLMQEVCPLTLLECYAAGRGIIASRNRIFEELIDEGKNGILVHPHDLSGFAQAVTRSIFDANKLQSMGSCARALAETKYAPEEHYSKIMSLYTSLVNAYK